MIRTLDRRDFFLYASGRELVLRDALSERVRKAAAADEVYTGNIAERCAVAYRKCKELGMGVEHGL